METDRDKLNAITELIIGCAYQVSNALEVGFLEKVYENSLAHELRKHGLLVKQQEPVTVMYDGVDVGKYFADLLIADGVIVEVKTVKALDDIHMAQCMNYLKATGLRICILLNFHETRVGIKRIVNNF